MADLDRDLSNRLSRLAEAVPVSKGRLDPVHRGAVEARQRVRMAWVTPLVFLVVAVLLTSVLGIGPFAPGATDGPVSATTRSGDFELTIRSTRSRYAAGEPIDISASLTYLGQGGPIEIGHDIGQDGSPIGFGVLEPIFEGYHLSGGVSRLMCHQSTVSPIEPINQPFRKTGGGYDGDGAGFVAYMRDPVFWLPEGTWHPYAIVSFAKASGPRGICGEEVRLVVEIKIEVGASPSAGTPVPSPLAADRSISRVTQGDFELNVKASKPTFGVDEPLDVVASLVYLGPEEHIVIHHTSWGPIGFGVWAPGITLTPRVRLGCTDLDLTRGVPITVALVNLNGGAPFSVAHGLHEVTATVEFGRGSCGEPVDVMATSIVVAVVDGADDIPLLTDEASQTGACVLMRNGGRLAASDSGLGVVTFDGKLRDVVWPIEYSARRTADGAVLLDPTGQVIASEGDDVAFDALTIEGHPLRPCGEVQGTRAQPDVSLPPVVPEPDSSPSPGREGDVRDEVDDGRLSLLILSPRASVHEGDPIMIYTQYHHLGRQDHVTIQHAGPPVVFHLEQLDATAPTAITLDAEELCTRSELGSGDEAVAFGDVHLLTGDNVTDHWLAEHLVGGKLRLPVGQWRVTARLVASTAACVSADSSGLLQASIDIEVLPESAGGIPLLTSATPPTIDRVCPVNAVTGTLARDSISGLGLVDSKGDHVPVRWPIDFSAERRPEGAVLYGWIGFTFAHEGEQLDLSGSRGADGIFEMCVPMAIAEGAAAE